MHPATAESEQFWTADAATRATLRTLRWRVTIAAVMVVVFVCTTWSIFLVKQDGKYSAIESTVGKIRSTQVTNTTRNDEIVTCDFTVSNDIVLDLRLLAAKDPDFSHYKLPVVCKALEQHKRLKK